MRYFSDNGDAVSSDCVIYTPSPFARSSLLHLQETGSLKALEPHKSERHGLSSCLFFIVESGKGRLMYDGQSYVLRAGDCVFIDCRKRYSYKTGENGELWRLSWCHFYGPNMSAIYHKYQECSNGPVFRAWHMEAYQAVLQSLYTLAGTTDYVREMKMHEKLSALLTMLMEDSRKGDPPGDHGEGNEDGLDVIDIQSVREYLDDHFMDRITLDELAARFYMNKYYLLTLFKERYDMTVNVYLNQVRVTYVKRELRFTGKTVERLAAELHIEPTYLSRLFKKAEGVTPSEYRRKWKGRDKE